MNKLNSEQFKKITFQERNSVFVDIINSVQEIVCKSHNELFIVRPVSIAGNEKIYIKPINETSISKSKDQIICQFIYRGENIYLFQAKIYSDRNGTYLETKDDFYMIQRRDNFRMKFPSTLSSKVTVKSTGTFLIGKLHDLSARGMRIALYTPIDENHIKQTFDFEIQIVGHPKIQISGDIRHSVESSELIKEKKTPIILYGVQFKDVSIENEKLLTKVNMELYRNFLQKVG